MTPLHDGQDYYRKMLELQERLRKSEEERMKLEERFNTLVQESRNRHEACINRLRVRYIEFLEEQRARDERNHKLLGALDKVDSSLALMTAKTDRLSILRKQYEAYLLRMYANRCPTGTGDSGVASQNDERSSKRDIPQVNPTLQSMNQSVEMSRVKIPAANLSRTTFQQSQTVPAEYNETKYMDPSGAPQYGRISQALVNLPYEQVEFSHRQQVPFAYEHSVMEAQGAPSQQYSPYTVRSAQIPGSPASVSEFKPQNVQYGRFALSSQPVLHGQQIATRSPQVQPEQSVSRYLSASVPDVPIDRNIPQLVASRIQEVVEPSSGNVAEFLPSMIAQDHQQYPQRHLMASQLVPGSGDLQSALTGDTSFNPYRQSTPLPGYLDYSIRYSRDSPKVEEESRSMTKSDLEDLIRRNERILPKNYLSRNERPKATGRTSKLSSILNKKSVVSDDKSTKALENELDNYISKIRSLHRDLDQQSLEELDHEQNTSGDLLNVTLSDDGLDLPVEEKSRENQVPEQVQEVLALADDLASSTANIENVLLGPTNESVKRQAVGESPKGMSSVETNVKREDPGYQMTLTNMTVNETGNVALPIKDNVCPTSAILAGDGIRAEIATSGVEIARAHKKIEELATPYVENSSVNLGFTIPSKQSDEIKRDGLKAVHEIPVNLAANRGQLGLDKREDTSIESKGSVLLEDIEGKGVLLLDEKPEIEVKALSVKKEVEPTSLQHFEKNIQQVEEEEEKDFVTEKGVRNDIGNEEVVQGGVAKPEILSKAGSVAEKMVKNVLEETSFEEKKLKTKNVVENVDSDLKDQKSYIDLRESQQSSKILKGDDYVNLNINDKKNVPFEAVPGPEPKVSKQVDRQRDEVCENLEEGPRNYQLNPTETLDYDHPDYDSSKTGVFKEKEYPSYDFESRKQLEQPIEYPPIKEISKSNEIRGPDSDYDHHMEQPYEHNPNEVYPESSDRQYQYGMGEQYVDETNQGYKYDPNVQYEHNPNEEYEQYAPDPKAQYEQYPGQHYSEYEHDPTQQYEHELSQQYEQDPNQEYEQDPNQQYAHDPHQQYEPNPNEQYEHYEQHPSQHYDPDQQYDSEHPYNPDQHYAYPAEGYEDQEQYVTEEHNPDEFVSNESYNPDEQLYFEQSAQPYPVEEEDYTRLSKNTEYNPDQSQPYEEGYKGIEEVLEDPAIREMERAVPEPTEDILRSEDKEEINREQKVEGQVEDKKKKKDVIKSLLDSDTDSTIERNVSNTTESDFDFN